jgi:hypothetical protein
MPKIALLSAVAVALALSACSKPTQDKTSSDLKAAGHEIGSAVKDVAATPALKAVGSDIKQGAHEAADKTKAAAHDAGPELKQAGNDLKDGAHKAGADIKSGTDKAADKANDATK